MSRGCLARFAVAAIIVVAPGAALADPLDSLRSQVGWGATVNPDRATLTSEGGWNGGAHRAELRAAAEVTLVPRGSVFVSATYGGLDTHARPAIGAAYQLLDPRTGVVGARLSLAYKTEGFTEPGGELESVLVLSRRFGADALRGMIAYGRDPEGNEADGELGVSYIHAAAAGIVVGGTARYRRGLALRAGEPRWDAIGGGIAGLALGRSRVEVLVGGESVAYAAVQTGVVGLISVGTEL